MTKSNAWIPEIRMHWFVNSPLIARSAVSVRANLMDKHRWDFLRLSLASMHLGRYLLSNLIHYQVTIIKRRIRQSINRKQLFFVFLNYVKVINPALFYQRYLLSLKPVQYINDFEHADSKKPCSSWRTYFNDAKVKNTHTWGGSS